VLLASGLTVLAGLMLRRWRRTGGAGSRAPIAGRLSLFGHVALLLGLVALFAVGLDGLLVGAGPAAVVPRRSGVDDREPVRRAEDRAAGGGRDWGRGCADGGLPEAELGENAEYRETTRLFTERYNRAAELIGSKDTAARTAGIYAIAGLANDWPDGRQTCIDVICACRRVPPSFTPTFAARPGEQVQIDSTPIDVMVLLETGMPVRADLTIAVDVATRTICAAALRPVGTKAVDAALLLARILVPEPMRPGWSGALRMSASRLPHARLVDVDARMELAAAKPVIVPDTIVIDGGKVFVSDTFTRACARLGISVQNCRPGTPTDKGTVEATFDAINTLFCQHVAAYTGSNTQLRGDRVDAQAA
jgi:transposase InsO family protein